MELRDVEVYGVSYPAYILSDKLRLRYQDSYNVVLEWLDDGTWNFIGFFQDAAYLRAFAINYMVWNKMRRTRFTDGFWRDVDSKYRAAAETHRILLSVGLVGMQELIVSLRKYKRTQEK